jgi:NADPH-dependent glutamate synthase beta subunit-like oxidoreductase/CO/xanthine dehydrogenase FAD-binding subunit
MKPFNHVTAKTTNEAVKSLKDYKGKASLIAGGTDLLGALKDKILPDYPEAVINIKTIPDLDYIREEGKGLKIGALTKLAEIAESPTVKEKYKLLAEAAEAVATPQIRRMGTIGGNLCQDLRCWYYRYPHHVGGRILCYLKGGKSCYALTGENQYNSIFGGSREANVPCSTACPGTVDIASYLSKIREGNLREAAKILLDANPIPSITGRVCPHFCEQECNRNEFDESVSIRDIERFMGDYILENANDIVKAPKIDTTKRVAIVGSGPAGLSAAYYLRISGHRVTVFDRMEEPGGMLAYGIPAFRLPKDIVKRIIKTLENTGIEFKLRINVGKDVTLGNLKNDFDSIFLASGAWSQPSIQLQGEELTKSGLEFLTSVNRGVKEIPGKRILVIGGGNVAVDVGITALRLGAEEVTLACLESRKEMPAFEWEIEQAVEEGVKLMPSWGPRRVLKTRGKVKGMELIRCTSVFDSEGRFAPTFDPSEKATVEADQIILAVGQRPDLSFMDPGLPLESDRGLIVSDNENQETSVPGIFAGGEVTSGPADVIKSIAAGRRAAQAIDLYLRGTMANGGDDDNKTLKPLLKFNSEYLKRTSRAESRKLPIPERGINVEDTVGLGLSEIETEANRCFNCGCLAVNSSDIAVALTALDAKIKIVGPTGTRRISIEDFFISLRNGLAADEMVTEIQVPRPPDMAKQTFLKFRLRDAIDFPLVSVASLINMRDGVCKDARIVLGAVAPRPTRATLAEKTIKGKAINASTAEAASEAAVIGTIPLNKNAYKIEITKTLVKRALHS